MKLLTDKIVRPLLSEKAAAREESLNEYALIVDASMTKIDIKKGVSQIFGIEPLGVRTLNARKKFKKTRFGTVEPIAYKKALIRLPEGKRLELK